MVMKLKFLSLYRLNTPAKATKRKNVTQPDAKIMAQIQALKEMYGIKKQTLELLLQDQLPIENIGCKC